MPEGCGGLMHRSVVWPFFERRGYRKELSSDVCHDSSITFIYKVKSSAWTKNLQWEAIYKLSPYERIYYYLWF